MVWLVLPGCEHMLVTQGMSWPTNLQKMQRYLLVKTAKQLRYIPKMVVKSCQKCLELYKKTYSPCPSVQSVLPPRVCKHCSLYFASNVMLKKHIIGVHKITGKCQPEVERVRPLRIAARRQQELMAVIAFTENVKFADWVDEDDIYIRGLTIPEDESVVKMPMYSMNEHISSPWKEES
ncbi:hypothetical protein AVEN_134947-1 [Araneus ventricosus]|uniref:C2H2-type domain-containing protein n=1 Tax=Araneus ventricosus TaxID=182803 RepID=A0A4Y2CIZ7_ARAVE|nr:hypothetical protein AVEN_134947-1 [Araneus ventricosus]